MTIHIALVFRQDLSILGIRGKAPQSVEVPASAVPKQGDVLGFSGVCLADGSAVMFSVVNRFFSFQADGSFSVIHLSLDVVADPSFV